MNSGALDTTQGYAALLDVYIRQYRAQVKSELGGAPSCYRTSESTAMLDQDIAALAQVFTQADALLDKHGDNTDATHTHAKMLIALIQANAGAIKSHLPLIQAADLRFIVGPKVALLDQSRLKGSAKRLVATDESLSTNLDEVIGQVTTALATAFPKPDPQQPKPEPKPEPKPKPEEQKAAPQPPPLPAPEAAPYLNLEPSYEDAGVSEKIVPKRNQIAAEEGEVFFTGPADMFDTLPSPLDALQQRGVWGFADGSQNGEGDEPVTQQSVTKGERSSTKKSSTRTKSATAISTDNAENTPEAEI